MATVTNLHPNPQAASDLSGGWAQFIAPSTAPTRVTSDGYRAGTSVQTTATGVTSGQKPGIYARDTVNYLSVTPGDWITVRAAVRYVAGTLTGGVAIRVDFFDSGGVAITNPSYILCFDYSAPGGGWKDLMGWVKVPAGAARMTVMGYVSGVTGSVTFRMTDVCVVVNAPHGIPDFGSGSFTQNPPTRPDPSTFLCGVHDTNLNYATPVLSWDQQAHLFREMGANSFRLSTFVDFADSSAPINFPRWNPYYAAMVSAGIYPILVSPAPPAWMTNYPWVEGGFDAQYAKLIRAHISQHPEAVAYDVWNEPNLGGAWGGTVDATRYVAFMQMSYNAVKAVRPDLPVLMGSTARVSLASGADISADSFFSGVYAAGGKPYFDGIGIHPYQASGFETSSTNGTVSRGLGPPGHVAAARRYMLGNADTGKKLWCTEFGADTDTMSNADQAQTLKYVISYLRQQPDVRGAWMHNLLNSGVGLNGLEVLQSPTYAQKPAFAACRDAYGGSRLPSRSGMPARLPIRRPVRVRA